METYGEGSWSKLVPYFSGRIGKQLRERWNHELRPDIQKGAWKEEEEKALVEQHRVHRNAWADIARVRYHNILSHSSLPKDSQKSLEMYMECSMRRLGLWHAGAAGQDVQCGQEPLECDAEAREPRGPAHAAEPCGDLHG